MAKAYSLDLRERVVAAVDRGENPAEVAQQFQITERTIWNWLALRKQTGDLKPRVGDVGPACVLEEHRERILRSVAEHPDDSLSERRQQLNLPGCLMTLSNALRRWGITHKKSPQGC